jgi:hypothetical protein
LGWSKGTERDYGLYQTETLVVGIYRQEIVARKAILISDTGIVLAMPENNESQDAPKSTGQYNSHQ